MDKHIEYVGQAFTWTYHYDRAIRGGNELYGYYCRAMADYCLSCAYDGYDLDAYLARN